MVVGKVMAFHSYKGGTGKTTLVTNLAAYYAKTGYKVCLLDMDLYAPSLCSYFKKTPDKYLNHLLHGEADIQETLIDITPELKIGGQLYVGLASPKKEDIQEIEIKQDQKWQLSALRKFLNIKKMLLTEYGFNFVLLDTSPGIRYWSINALAASDVLFMLMKINDMDIDGTRRMLHEIYDSLTRFGSKNYLILNKVGGASPIEAYNDEESISSIISDIEKNIGLKVLLSIPCYCDLQFSRHEYLSAIQKPDHPFSQRIHALAEKVGN